MGKIDDFNTSKRVYERLHEDIMKARGLKDDWVIDSQNDKHSFRASFIRLDGNWSEMLLSIHASYGYYGSSSGYSASSDELGKYLAKAITAKIPELSSMALEYARLDMEEKRTLAIDEARAVLDVTK